MPSGSRASRPGGRSSARRTGGGPSPRGAAAVSVRHLSPRQVSSLRQGDLLRRPGQPVAALDAALAADDPGLSQVAQDVLEELERHLLGLRDALALDRAAAVDCCQLDARAQCVVGLGGDPHVPNSYCGYAAMSQAASAESPNAGPAATYASSAARSARPVATSPSPPRRPLIARPAAGNA